MQDEIYMARAMKLAQRGRFTTHPNPNVGCVIVKDGEIVGEVLLKMWRMWLLSWLLICLRMYQDRLSRLTAV